MYSESMFDVSSCDTPSQGATATSYLSLVISSQNRAITGVALYSTLVSGFSLYCSKGKVAGSRKIDVKLGVTLYPEA